MKKETYCLVSRKYTKNMNIYCLSCKKDTKNIDLKVI